MEKSKIIAIVALVVFGAVMYLSKRPPASNNNSTPPPVAETKSTDAVPPTPKPKDNPATVKSTSDSDIPKVVDNLIKKDIKVGTGTEAESGDTVTVNYKGTLTNGSQFDSSYDRGQPFTFQLGAGNVIQGWDEGVPGMKVGGKRKLIIPSDLGYGEQGMGADIPPNSTLVFEVELLKVEK